MGISSSAAPQQPDTRRTIRFAFAATVAIPAICMIALWALAAGVVAGTSLHGHRFWSPDHREVVELMILVGAGLLIALICVILMGRFSARLSRDIAGLADTARHTADERLPQLLERLRRGETASPATPPAAAPSRPRRKNVEIARALTAVASLEQTAVGAASGEAGLRDRLRQVFVSLARRNQSLLQRQPPADRRAGAEGVRLHGAGRSVRAGPPHHPDAPSRGEPGHPGGGGTRRVLDRAGAGHRRHPRRDGGGRGLPPGHGPHRLRGRGGRPGRRGHDPPAGGADRERDHVLPVGNPVEVRADRVANGFAVEIDDRGLGIEAAHLAEINQQLAQPPDFDLANADRLGLFVGAKLAARHGVRVSLRQSPTAAPPRSC